MDEFLPSEARNYRYGDISVGRKDQREYVISSQVYENFLTAFDDRSPIHFNEAYALECGFSGKVMHGALLNGFLSHFVGMYFPGRLSLLLSVDLRFLQPSCLGDVIRLESIVTQKFDARNVVIMDVTFNNMTRDYIAARGRIRVMLRDEQ